MSKFSDRARERLISQLSSDPRLGGETVLSAAPMTRASFLMLGLSGVLGFIFVLSFFGSGSAQLIIGLFVGYAAYLAFVLYLKPGPRLIGLFGVLTNKKVVLLGSSKMGVVQEWKLSELDSVELRRKGNFIIMGKVAFNPRKGEPMVFFVSNQPLGRHFVAEWQRLRAK